MAELAMIAPTTLRLARRADAHEQRIPRDGQRSVRGNLALHARPWN